MIEINSLIPAEFPNGKETEIENFADLILINCPKLEMFSLDGVINELNLGKQKDRQFNALYLDVTNLLKESNLIKHVPNTSGYFKLDNNGKIAKAKGGYFEYLKFMDNKESETSSKSIIYNINDSIVGQINHESDVLNSPYSINVNEIPTKNENKSILHKAWNVCSKNPLVSGIILLIISSVITYIISN